ncbi:DUF5455 family protein [Salinicola sp. JS01]|uniref:DUF5455 family protein n=1 Tax=Salinicola sp. JS01 TaxID=3050071 RepID=UPI00255B8013|nr:DUF5455 family protein [Salinicola sp. JS01]WIX31602.1 DUF5455 family protein [Salinicola sp. JS01]
MAAPAVVLGLSATIWKAIVHTIGQGVFNGNLRILLARIGVGVGLFILKATILATVIVYFYSGVSDFIDTIIVSLPPMLSDGIARILPSNFVACVSAILGVKALAFIFAIHSKLISMFMGNS